MTRGESTRDVARRWHNAVLSTSEGIDAVLLSFPCRAKATAAVALATAAAAGAAVADAAAPARAGQVRAREWWLQALHITRAWATSKGAGTFAGVISVGAFDQNIVKARFTNRRAYVTLTSAGAGVTAATPSGGYARFDGTSAASAVVAGRQP
jgi:hypothetical protein